MSWAKVVIVYTESIFTRFWTFLEWFDIFLKKIVIIIIIIIIIFLLL